MGTADGSGGGSPRGPLYPQLSLVALASTPGATTPPPRRVARAAPSNMAVLAEGEGEVGPNGSQKGLRCGFLRHGNIYFWGQMQIPRQISAAPCLSVTSWGCGAAGLGRWGQLCQRRKQLWRCWAQIWGCWGHVRGCEDRFGVGVGFEGARLQFEGAGRRFDGAEGRLSGAGGGF